MNTPTESLLVALNGGLRSLCHACRVSAATINFSSFCAVPGKAGLLQLGSIFTTLTRMKVTPGSGLCDPCIKQCLAAYQFTSMCARTEAQLRNSVLLLERCVSNRGKSNHLYIPLKLHTNSEQDETDTELLAYDCCKCSKSFTTQYLLDLHSGKHVDKRPDKQHVCKYCAKTFSRDFNLKCHIASQHRNHICDVCGNICCSFRGLQIHQKAKHPEVTRPARVNSYSNQQLYKCARCPYSAKEKRYLASHVRRRHMKQSNDTHVCDVCGIVYKTADRLEMHRAAKHPQVARSAAPGRLTCQYCGRSFKRLKVFNKHVDSHKGTPKQTRMYRCAHCPYAANTKNYLAVHIRRRHTKERPYSCDLCPSAFSVRRELRLHMSVHTGMRTELCDVCNRRFVGKNELIYHKRLHTGERPYQCATCGERFVSSTRLGVHMRNKHNPQPVCHICGKILKTERNLKLHINTVHSETLRDSSFQCEGVKYFKRQTSKIPHQMMTI